MYPYNNKNYLGNAKRKKRIRDHMPLVLCALVVNLVLASILYNEYLNRQYDKELSSVSAPIPKYTIKR